MRSFPRGRGAAGIGGPRSGSRRSRTLRLALPAILVSACGDPPAPPPPPEPELLFLAAVRGAGPVVGPARYDLVVDLVNPRPVPLPGARLEVDFVPGQRQVFELGTVAAGAIVHERFSRPVPAGSPGDSVAGAPTRKVSGPIELLYASGFARVALVWDEPAHGPTESGTGPAPGSGQGQGAPGPGAGAGPTEPRVLDLTRAVAERMPEWIAAEAEAAAAGPDRAPARAPATGAP